MHSSDLQMANPKPTLGKALFLTETIRVMAFTLQHLSKATKQTSTVYMTWQATYGNGALTCTTKTTIKHWQTKPPTTHKGLRQAMTPMSLMP